MLAPSLPLFPRLIHVLSRFVRLIAWVVLCVGLVLGVGWASLHFWIVPRIGDHRPALERLAQQTLGVPVRIGQISAESTGWAPSFELRDIALLDPEGRTALHLPKVWIAISVRSVLSLKLEQLVLDAPELDIRLMANGHWRVAGLEWTQGTNTDNAVADWLFSQREVIVRGGTLHWTQESPDAAAPSAPAQAISLREVDVVLRNSARHHDVRVDATPPAEWGKRFVSMGRFKRNLLSMHPGHWGDWTGQAYADLPLIDLAQLSPHLPGKVQMASGRGSLRLWSDVTQGQWAGGVADVMLTGLKATWAPDKAPLGFERLSGRLGAKVNPLGFEASTQQLAFVSDQGLAWPGGNLSLSFTRPQGKTPARGQLQAQKLDLLAMRDIALHLPLPEAWRQGLQEQTVSGQIDTLQWRWQGDWKNPQTYDAQLALQKLTLAPPEGKPSPLAHRWPGVKGAQIKVSLNQDRGRVDLDIGANGALFLPGVLDEAEVPVQTLHAHALVKHEAELWHVPDWKIQLNNEDLQGEWQGQWHPSSQAKGLGKLDMQGKIKQVNASRIHRYLPLRLPKDVRQYVQDAVHKGVYANVQMKVKGDLEKLPFANPKDGEFRIAGRIQDVELDYWPAALMPPPSVPWPLLHKLTGQLVFDRSGMKLSKASARMDDARVGLILNDIEVDISDMATAAVLNVAAEHKGPASPLLGLVQKSPLDALLSGALRQTQATGNVQTRFKLTVPLLNPNNTKVQGTVGLSGNDVRMTPDAPLLENLQGSVQFTESGFSLSGAQARMLGGPVRIEGGMRSAPSGSGGTGNEIGLQLRAQGQVTAEGLRQAKEIGPVNELAKHASGSTSYTAQLAWRQGSPEFSVQSQLEGLALSLPAPLGKTAAASTALMLRTRVLGSGPGLQEQWKLDWGQTASAHYVRDLSGPEPVVLRGSLTLGLPASQAPAMPDTGVNATVSLDKLSLDDWQNLLPKSTGTAARQPGTAANAWQTYVPTRVGLQANTLQADGRTLHQVVAGGLREGSTWKVNVDARELNGHVVYRQPTGDQLGHLYARLSRLNLLPSSVSEVEGLLDDPPINLPALDIVVEQLELRGKKFGRVEIEAINTDPAKIPAKTTTEWQLSKLNVSLPEANFRSTGRWFKTTEAGAQRKTEMNFKLDVSDAGALLTRLGTPDALRGGSGQMEGLVSWQGSPLAFHYPSMSGQFGITMGRGQFLKADAGAAKLLGVLSLQALPRRLLLDFRDVFYEGFAFDSVRGDVTIAKGIAQTRNLQIKGVNALVQLDGSADIAQETQKLRVVILPSLDAGTASLVAGIAVNPVVGITAFLAQLFLQKPLMKVNTQEFLIDGSWAEPRVTKVHSDAKAPPAAHTPP